MAKNDLDEMRRQPEPEKETDRPDRDPMRGGADSDVRGIAADEDEDLDDTDDLDEEDEDDASM